MEEEYDHVFKVILAGDSGVGKTFLLNRFVKGSLPLQAQPTIGVEFATKLVKTKTGERIKTQLWDTAGQERYRSITSAHYRKAVGALVVYDVTQEKTFQSLQRWVDEIKSQAEPDIIIMLVGNKADLIENNPSFRKVLKERAQNFAHDNKLLYEETSAITSNNVQETLGRLLQEICHLRNIKEDKSSGQLLISNNNKLSNKQGCCS